MGRFFMRSFKLLSDKKTFLNYQLTGVLDDLSDMVKDPFISYEKYYQPLRQVVDLLSQGASINTQNKRGETLLHLACYSADPLYGVEPYSLKQKLSDVKCFFNDMVKTAKLSGLVVLKSFLAPFSKKVRQDLASLACKIPHIATRYQRRGAKEVFLPLEKIVSAYHPNPFLVDKRLNTPAMALTAKLRQPLKIEKDKIKLSEEQLDYKYEELNILDAYAQAFQAQQTARALKSLMVLASLTDEEKVSTNMPKVSRDVIHMTEYQDTRVSPATTEQAERLIKTIIKATNNLSGVSDKTNQNEG